MINEEKKENITKGKIIWRWSLFTFTFAFVIIGCFGAYRGNLDIGSINKIYAAWWTIELPFAVSRWWDVLYGPLFITSCVLLWPDESKGLFVDFWANVRMWSAIGLGMGFLLGGSLGILSAVCFGVICAVELDVAYMFCFLVWKLLHRPLKHLLRFSLFEWLFFRKF